MYCYNSFHCLACILKTEKQLHYFFTFAFLPTLLSKLVLCNSPPATTGLTQWHIGDKPEIEHSTFWDTINTNHYHTMKVNCQIWKQIYVNTHNYNSQTTVNTITTIVILLTKVHAKSSIYSFVCSAPSEN